MKIAMIQQNYTVGDFEVNISKALEACEQNKNADIIVFSELSLSGYYPWDLIERPSFMKKQNIAFNQLKEFSKTINSHIVIGMVRLNESGIGKPFLNSLIVIHNGHIVFDYDKKLLPTYNIFDEKRHFEEGVKPGIANLKIEEQIKHIGFFVCEDGWNDETYDYITNPIKELASAGASILIGINASPSNLKKREQRDILFGKIAKRYVLDLVYVNQVGGYDDIVFDGASFVFNDQGEKVIQLASFIEDSATYDTDLKYKTIPCITHDKNEFIFNQISLGLKDYLGKQGISKVVVGSSGGIDSALTLAIAALTLGKDNVEAITMPSKYSSSGSVTDSEELCNNLGIKLYNYAIADEFLTINNNFEKSVNETLQGVAAENLQARIRGTVLMAYSNQKGNLLLTTGNKSEIAVGYFTLYGDSNGGLNLIGDLYKTEVFSLCRWINEKFGVLIPVSIIEKPPSAELAPDQKDTDSLPDYEHLDAILKKELEWSFLTPEEKIVIDSLIHDVDEQIYKKVLRLIDKSEFKRKQSAVIIRIHHRAFGHGRKVPIVHRLEID